MKRGLRILSGGLFVFAAGMAVPSSPEYIEAEVHGRLDGTRIHAAGASWTLDASTDALRQALDKLQGRAAIAKGRYVERGSPPGPTLVLESLRADTGANPVERIDVTVRGTLRAGVMAIGGETTGITIVANAVTWELDVPPAQREAAIERNNQAVTVRGTLSYRGGIEIRRRAIVKVRSIR